MKIALTILALIVIASFSASAQQPVRQDPLLDHMTGKWVLQGTIAGQAATHDIEADWVLNHEYVRLHEISREKDAQGRPIYEAIIFIDWNASLSEYTCLFLDSTEGGGLSPETFGHAKPNGDEIPLLFKLKNGFFHTTLAYDKSSDTWQWLLDDEEGGKLTPFARLKLTRKKGD
jgi:hypothetical protein